MTLVTNDLQTVVTDDVSLSELDKDATNRRNHQFIEGKLTILIVFESPSVHSKCFMMNTLTNFYFSR